MYKKEDLAEAKKLIEAANTIVILAPDSQDGDSASSNLALKQTLESMSKDVYWIGAEGRDKNYDFLAGNDTIELPNFVDDKKQKIDLVIITDAGGLNMFERALNGRRWLVEEKPVILFDHHAVRDSAKFKVEIISDASATGELLYHVYRDMGWEITPQIARLLMVGIYTDTQNFANLNTNAEILGVASELAKLGAEPGLLSEEMKVAFAPEPAGFRIIAELLTKVVFDSGVAYCLVPNSVYRQAPSGTSIRHEVGNAIRYVAGVKISFVIIEKDGRYQLSMRSHHGYDVAAIASQFGGGGHKVAAGASMSGFASLQAAGEEVLKLAKAEASKEIAK